ncbi:hypothetical protein O6H91_19G018800 [Diphasiastrum complanatum]|uniref:Uncharacterized protein n=1 Tax=Diphasiastrum complanatum TaxID=34168 RepID=A0ACC2AT45_DIPCM|nr:hypothetical protein O6H91_Y422200 [Diphasiastrum complanatum]KAJ7520707.1 hypothetical protein O6H91_19G018800 [Diphasiastrum complanatum]
MVLASLPFKSMTRCRENSEFESDLVVGTAIVTMYGKCGSLKDARKMFDKMLERNLVSWNAMIAAYTQHGYGKEALELFKQMQLEGLHPDKVTLVSILDACASVTFLEIGRYIHAWIVNDTVNSDVSINTAVLNMYGKCGELEDAQGLFDGMPHRDTVSWNALIAAYSQHGEGAFARKLFGQMQWEGTNPNQVSLVSILSACSHAGLMEEGFHYFCAINVDHGIVPLMDHYACMVDLLGRSGRLNDACTFVMSMPFKPGAVVWMTLLGACRVYKNVELAKWAAEQLLEVDNQNDAPYVVLSNIYAAAGRWEDVVRVRTMMKERCVKRQPGRSLIEVEGKVHEFLVSDSSHLQREEIYKELQRLSYQITKVGYVPDTQLVLHDVEEEEKEDMIWEHSEKLALSFGLISTPSGTPLRIIKNLRVCSDCHTAIKFVSKVVGRDILVRDSNRFHHFQHGMCSCGDYW